MEQKDSGICAGDEEGSQRLSQKRWNFLKMELGEAPESWRPGVQRDLVCF